MKPILSGLKVIDLSQVLSGPYCTMVLGDLGADVIKVEKYPNGDDTRQMGAMVNNESYNFMMVNRSKKGIRLNLKTEEGKKILYDLVKNADVFVENFRPGVAKKLGFDYESLKEINSEIIYCSISGYGQTGPYSYKGGYDIMAQGMSGIMGMTGDKGGRPVKVGIAMHDVAAGVTAIYSILAAYISKLKNGKGDYIDISLVDSGLAWTVWEAAGYFGANEIAKPNGSRHRIAAPYQGFRTKDGYVLVGAANQKLWEVFCRKVIRKEEWITYPQFLTNADRQQNIEQLEEYIEGVFIECNSEYWLSQMEKNGIPCGPIHHYDEVLTNEHVLSRNMVIEYDHPIAGKIKNLGVPTKFLSHPIDIHTPAPYLGQHSEEILKGLNYTEKEIQALKEDQII
ncbi:MAG: CaiB/BaiF CoA transferase family protein [Bacillota bacterium]